MRVMSFGFHPAGLATDGCSDPGGLCPPVVVALGRARTVNSVCQWFLQKAECSDGGIHCEGGSTSRRDLLHAGKIPASAALLQGRRLPAAAEYCKCLLTHCVAQCRVRVWYLFPWVFTLMLLISDVYYLNSKYCLNSCVLFNKLF